MLTLLVLLVLVGLLLYFVEKLPLDPTIKGLIRAVAIIAVVIYALLCVIGLLQASSPGLNLNWPFRR